jgi:hypothetical protein
MGMTVPEVGVMTVGQQQQTVELPPTAADTTAGATAGVGAGAPFTGGDDASFSFLCLFGWEGHEVQTHQCKSCNANGLMRGAGHIALWVLIGNNHGNPFTWISNYHVVSDRLAVCRASGGIQNHY